jgi:hypothetical protein
VARDCAEGGDAANANDTAAALLAEIQALKERLAALEARPPQSAPAELPPTQAMLPPLPSNQAAGAALEPGASARVARRRALGLGALAAALAFIGRSAARAADALTIDAEGIARFSGKRNWFTDVEGKSPLRVGAANGVPGIWSEKGDIIVGSSQNIWLDAGKPGNIWLDGKVGVNKSNPTQSLDVAGTIAAGSLVVAGPVTAGNAALNGPLRVALASDKSSNWVDIANSARTNFPLTSDQNGKKAQHPTGLALYVTANSTPDGGGIEFRSDNASQGIGFGHNTIYATGDNDDQHLYLKARGNGTVQLAGQKNGKANLHVAGGQVPLRILYGLIYSGAKAGAGMGEKAVKTGNGTYQIKFEPPFTGLPAANVTVFGSGSPQYQAIIYKIAADEMVIITGTADGTVSDLPVSFIVIGPW